MFNVFKTTQIEIMTYLTPKTTIFTSMTSKQENMGTIQKISANIPDVKATWCERHFA